MKISKASYLERVRVRGFVVISVSSPREDKKIKLFGFFFEDRENLISLHLGWALNYLLNAQL